MTDTGLWIGFFVAVAAATAMVSYMLYYQAANRHVPLRRVRSAIIQVWLAVVIGLSAGVSVRILLGGEVIALGRDPQHPLAVWVRALRTHETLALAAAFAVIALCFLWAMRAARSITEADAEAAASEGGDAR